MRDRSRRSNGGMFSSTTANAGTSLSRVGVVVDVSEVPATSSHERPILRLWARWMPQLRGLKMSEMAISNLRERHRGLCLSLLRSGASERQIRRSQLDSPWIRDDERKWLIAEFLETHREKIAHKEKRRI